VSGGVWRVHRRIVGEYLGVGVRVECSTVGGGIGCSRRASETRLAGARHYVIGGLAGRVTVPVVLGYLPR